MLCNTACLISVVNLVLAHFDLSWLEYTDPEALHTNYFPKVVQDKRKNLRQNYGGSNQPGEGRE